MARIPFVPLDLAEPKDIVDAVRARRGGPLLELDRLLLHSAPFTRGWNAHLKAVRTQLTVPANLRELAICTVAVLNGAEYEFVTHLPNFAQAGGTKEQVAAIRDVQASMVNAQLFDAAERATIRLAYEMTRNIKVEDAAFDAIAQMLSHEHLVELIGTIATYNMVSRFLIAFELHPE